MTLIQAVLLALVGAIAGFLNVMAGGGSLLTLPALVFLGLTGPVANGTNRIAIVAQNIFAVSGFFRQGVSDFRLSITLALAAVPGAIAGAFVGTRLEGVWFNRVLASIMIAVLILMARRRRDARAPEEPAEPAGNRDANRAEPYTGHRPSSRAGRTRLAVTHLLMVGVGFYGGFIQAGVGFLMMAILHRVLRLDLVRVNSHKVFIAGVYSIPAIAVYAWFGNVFWVAGAVLAAGNAAGGWIGSHVAVRKGEPFIRAVLFVALVIMALRLVTLPA